MILLESLRSRAQKKTTFSLTLAILTVIPNSIFLTQQQRLQITDYFLIWTSLSLSTVAEHDLINVVTAKGLEGGFNALWKAIEALERNSYPKVTILCEPQLGKRDLYPALLTEHTNSKVMQMLNLITWSDGAHSLIDIAELCDSPIWELYPIVKKLEDHKLIEVHNEPS